MCTSLSSSTCLRLLPYASHFTSLFTPRRLWFELCTAPSTSLLSFIPHNHAHDPPRIQYWAKLAHSRPNWVVWHCSSWCRLVRPLYGAKPANCLSSALVWCSSPWTWRLKVVQPTMVIKNSRLYEHVKQSTAICLT